MLHFIGHVGRRDTEFYIRKHVFPGGWLPSLADVIVEMENAGLEVVDIENLRRHYAFTLDAWAERFDRNWPRIQALDPKRFDERFRRVWRVYLYGCAEMFRSPTGRTHLFQIVFAKGNVTHQSYPMSRAFLYEAEEAPAGAGLAVRRAGAARAERSVSAALDAHLREARRSPMSCAAAKAAPGSRRKPRTCSAIARPARGAGSRWTRFARSSRSIARAASSRSKAWPPTKDWSTNASCTASCPRSCRSSRPSPSVAPSPAWASNPPPIGSGLVHETVASSRC
jgi:hypothetical protein